MAPVDYLRGGIAELVGTFALVFVGAGAIIYGDIVGVALASGLVVAVMATSLLPVSKGLFNPAITFALVITRRIPIVLGLVFVVAQLGAAALAALLLDWALPENALANLGAPAVSPGLGVGEAVVIEATLTFFLVWVVFATAIHERNALRQVAGLAIGLTVSAGILMGAGLTGAAMNPARAFGPELVSNTWDDWQVWVLGPVAGATIAAVVYEMLYLRSSSPPAPDAEQADRPEPVLSGPATATDADV